LEINDLLPFLRIGLRKVDFQGDGNEPLFKEKLRRYMIGGESINLQLNKNIGERPSGPIAFL